MTSLGATIRDHKYSPMDSQKTFKFGAGSTHKVNKSVDF